MSHVYVPTPVALGSVTLPDDGDAEVVASVNTPFQAIADGVEYLNVNAYPRRNIFAATGTWKCPANCYFVTLYLRGGDGGGGGGGGPLSGAPKRSTGGGGGGAAKWVRHENIPVVPGDVYGVVIGTGGAGGAAGSNSAATQATTIGGNGSPGGNTSFEDPLATVLAYGYGAQGGIGGQAVTTDTSYGLAPGGLAINGSGRPPANDTTDQYRGFQQGEGSGGEGVCSLYGVGNGRKGYPSATGYTGGTAGTLAGNGASDGGAGGGGAAGPYGNGGAGGNGKTGGAAGTPATVGANATAGGGGGGGGGGQNNVAAWTPGAAGGSGGTGMAVVLYSGESAVVT